MIAKSCQKKETLKSEILKNLLKYSHKLCVQYYVLYFQPLLLEYKVENVDIVGQIKVVEYLALSQD